MKKTLYDKIWEKHLIPNDDKFDQNLIYIDLHLIHEVTSPQAFSLLREKSLNIHRPDKTLACVDHVIPTQKDSTGRFKYRGEKESNQVETLLKNCKDFGITCFAAGHEKQGIVHVFAPENGYSLPGMTIVCGDSHTSTHGAFAALAFGIGTSEVACVMGCQTLLQKKSKTMGIKIDGKLNKGVFAKDLILKIIAEIGTNGATGHVIEYYGSTISSLSMDERMTICNMSIEAGAKAGLIAADQVTFDYLKNRLSKKEYENGKTSWESFFTDEGAQFDKDITIDANTIQAMVSYGTNPEKSIPLRSAIPEDANESDLKYMNFQKEKSLIGEKIDMAFVGSCTNGRLSDLRVVASLLKENKIADHVKMLIVPGSMQTKLEAENEGLDKIFKQAGAEWREPGCSMCLGMNGDIVDPGKLCISTSNRNFRGRQGTNSRTVLASPFTATLSAIKGEIASERIGESEATI